MEKRRQDKKSGLNFTFDYFFKRDTRLAVLFENFKKGLDKPQRKVYRINTKNKVREEYMKTFVRGMTYEGLTDEEIERYLKEEKTVKEVYGKYGNLALKYMKEHNKAKYWSLAGDLPEYLHNIDKRRTGSTKLCMRS